MPQAAAAVPDVPSLLQQQQVRAADRSVEVCSLQQQQQQQQPQQQQQQPQACAAGCSVRWTQLAAAAAAAAAGVCRRLWCQIDTACSSSSSRGGRMDMVLFNYADVPCSTC
jgi:hypothetical protein